MTGRRLLLAALALCAAAPALANKPVIGVSCGGGFFVRAPGGVTYWIHGEPPQRMAVHQGPDRFVGMAECGPGVVSVFSEPKDGGLSKVFYSPDCRNLGAQQGATQALFAGPERVRGLLVEEGRVVIGLEGGGEAASPACGRR